MNVALMPVHRWIDWNISGHGTISILDARDAGDSATAQVEEDLRRQSADVVFLFDDGESNLARPSASNFMLHLQDDIGGALDDAKVIGVSFGSERRAAQLDEALKAQLAFPELLRNVSHLTQKDSYETRVLLSVQAFEQTCHHKMEMIRIARD